MIGESIYRPKLIERTRGGLVVRFDVQALPADDFRPERYQYDSVRVADGASRGEMIDAVIGSRYSHADEIALINNRDIGPEGATKYVDYQKFRAQAKAWVDEALGEEA